MKPAPPVTRTRMAQPYAAWRARGHAPLRCGDDGCSAGQAPGASAELGDQGAVALAHDRYVGDAAAAVGCSHSPLRDEDVPKPGRGDERDVGAGRHGQGAPAVADESERRVGESEDVSPVRDVVTVD